MEHGKREGEEAAVGECGDFQVEAEPPHLDTEGSEEWAQWSHGGRVETKRVTEAAESDG